MASVVSIDRRGRFVGSVAREGSRARTGERGADAGRAARQAGAARGLATGPGPGLARVGRLREHVGEPLDAADRPAPTRVRGWASESGFVLEAVGLERGGRWLLDDVSLTLPIGEVSVVVGANGAGKSTLIGLLAGDVTPTRGRVTWRGRSLARWCPRRLACERAVVVQEPPAAQGLLSEELVALGRLPHGAAPDERWTLVRAMQSADALELWGRDVGSLSGGERQRVQTARALAQIDACDWAAPGALLLDEPTSALDVHHQLRLVERLREWAARGLAVVVVLHDLELAARAADRLIVLRDGRVVAVGPPHAVLNAETLAEGWSVAGRVGLDPERPILRVRLDAPLG